MKNMTTKINVKFNTIKTSKLNLKDNKAF